MFTIFQGPGGGANVCAGGVQIISVGVAIYSEVFKTCVDLCRLVEIVSVLV